MNLLLSKIRLITLLGLAFACGRPVDEPVQSTEPVTFDAQTADSILAAGNRTDQWDYLQSVAEQAYTNTEQVDVWLLQRLEEYCQEEGFPSVSKLSAITFTLYHAAFGNTKDVWARAILSDSVHQGWSSVKGLASAILVNQFLFLQEMDSLDKYLTVMEGYLESDSSLFLSRLYYSSKGALAEYRGDFFEAVVNYSEAFQFTEDTDTMYLFLLHNDVANLYVNMNFPEKATYHADQAIASLGIENIPPTYFNTFGVTKANAGEYEEAEALYTRAIEYGLANEFYGLLAMSYSNYGNLKRKQGQYDEALMLMETSDSICRTKGLDIGLFINQINRSELYFDQGDYAIAENAINEAFPALLKFDMPYMSLEYYKLRHRIYDAQGKEVLAYRDLQQYLHFQEEYLGDLPRSIISEWERTTEREKLSEEAAQLALSLEREVKNKYLISFILAVLVLVVGIFYFFINRRQLLERQKAEREKQALRYELEMKSKELLTESLNNIHIQQTKDQILERLEQILSDMPLKEKNRFSHLTQQLKSNTEAEYLTEFETRFTGVYEEFTQKLLTIAPNLTPNELRICAFIRLNITSKDIARLTNRNLGTVENTRTNIRRKLQLGTDDNLQQFLLAL